MKTFATDLDGVLLDLNSSVAALYSKILGVEVTPNDLTSWDHTWALGIPQSIEKAMWPILWLQEEAKPYAGVNVFIECLKILGFETVVITNRPDDLAKSACLRDIAQLKGLKDVIIMDKSIHPKSYHVNKLGAEYYLEDNIEYAIDVKLNSPKVKEVFLITRSHNAFCKDIMGYRRVKSYGDVLAHLSQSV